MRTEVDGIMGLRLRLRERIFFQFLCRPSGAFFVCEVDWCHFSLADMSDGWIEDSETMQTEG